MIRDFTSSLLSDLFSQRGRSVAVTGGAKGIGAAVCVRFAELGADVAIGDLDISTARELADDLARRFSVKTLAVTLDVRSAASVEHFADAAMSLSGELHVWVNNAGIFPYNRISDISDEEWRDVMEINAGGVFYGIRAAACRMRQGISDGMSKAIVNISSMSGLNGQIGRAHYSASKHAVMGLTKSAARELGPDGIRVVSIAPTMVTTPGLDTFNQAGGAGDRDAIEKGLMSRIPLGRICHPDDVARVAVFCASDLAGMVTGSCINVDGGFGAS